MVRVQGEATAKAASRAEDFDQEIVGVDRLHRAQGAGQQDDQEEPEGRGQRLRRRRHAQPMTGGEKAQQSGGSGLGLRQALEEVRQGVPGSPGGSQGVRRHRLQVGTAPGRGLEGRAQGPLLAIAQRNFGIFFCSEIFFRNYLWASLKLM